MKRLCRATTLRAVEETVGGLLARSPALQRAPARLREQLGDDLVALAMLAADQLAEELILTDQARRVARGRPSDHGPLARAQAAAAPSMAATAAAGDAIRSIKDAIDFPTYVTSLITGVFQAIVTSNIQQIEAIADLLANVSASSSEFSSRNIGMADAASWAVGRFGFFVRGDASQGGALLRLRPDADLTDHSAELESALKLTKEEVGGIDEDRLDETLLPLVRRAMGRDRQSNLATLVMMGLNRLLVDKGEIHASMDMRVDARSAAESAQHARSDHRTNVGTSGGAVGAGWGVAAQTSTSIGQVKDDQNESNVELASQAGLRSSVDLVFHTEPINLDQMLAHEQRKAIIANSRVPEAKYTTGSILTEQKAKTGIAELGAIPDVPQAPATPDMAMLAQSRQTIASQTGAGGGTGGDAGGGASDDAATLGSRGTAAHLEHDHHPILRVRDR